jgi:hypothetical protein
LITCLTKEQILAKEIHAAFDEAANSALVAPEYKIPEKKVLEEKTKRLKKLGFTGCEEVAWVENFNEKKEALLKRQKQNLESYKYAQMYAKKYPKLKFIGWI